MRKKIKMDIDACKPRMVMAETIYSDYGAVIVWENTVLDKLTINRLKIFGIEKIWVYEYDESDEEPEESKPRSETEVFSVFHVQLIRFYREFPVLHFKHRKRQDIGDTIFISILPVYPLNFFILDKKNRNQ